MCLKIDGKAIWNWGNIIDNRWRKCFFQTVYGGLSKVFRWVGEPEIRFHSWDALQTFRYLTLRAPSYHAVALSLRILYACVRWADMERDEDDVGSFYCYCRFFICFKAPSIKSATQCSVPVCVDSLWFILWSDLLVKIFFESTANASFLALLRRVRIEANIMTETTVRFYLIWIVIA